MRIEVLSKNKKTLVHSFSMDACRLKASKVRAKSKPTKIKMMI